MHFISFYERKDIKFRNYPLESCNQPSASFCEFSGHFIIPQTTQIFADCLTLFLCGTHAFGVQKMHIFAANFCYKILRSLRNNKKCTAFSLLKRVHQKY